MEDSLIYYRYIENAILGNGLVYNIGEYYNSLSSPLHTYMSLFLALLIRDIHTSQVILGFLLSTLWGLLLLYFLKDRLDNPFLLFVPMVVIHPYFFRVTGMETHLFILLSTVALILFQERKYAWLGIVLSLLLMTRGESLFLVMALAIEHFRRKRPLPPRRFIIAPALFLLANYFFNYMYYGSFFPHTLSAKISQGKSGFWGPWPVFIRVKHHIDWFFGGSVPRALAFLLLAAMGFITVRRTWFYRVVVAFLLLYTAFFVVLNIPNYHWYYSMYYYFGGISLIFVFHWGWRRLTASRLRFPSRVAKMILLAVLLVIAAGHIAQNLRELPKAGPPLSYKRIGLWMNKYLEPDAKIAAAEIGTIGWYSKRYIIDIVGLISPPNADFIAQRRYTEWLQHYHPDYILIHDPPWAIEKGILDHANAVEFVWDHSFRFDNYRLLARTSDRLSKRNRSSVIRER